MHFYLGLFKLCYNVYCLTGRILDYVIEPVKISLPLNASSSHKSVKQVSCGRAHSMFLTDEGGRCFTHLNLSLVGVTFVVY